jgi:hypothetical protein
MGKIATKGNADKFLAKKHDLSGLSLMIFLGSRAMATPWRLPDLIDARIRKA